MEKKEKILIIIPAYNEEAAILKTYNTIMEFNRTHNRQLDVIVINDGSIDNTLNILIENNIPHISLIMNLGIGGAVQTGYRYARDNGYDVAIQYDGDGQHDINCVDDIVEPITAGEADMVIGSRFVKGSKSEFKSSTARRIGIKIISWEIKIVTRKKLYDITSGFRAVNRDIICRFANSYPIEYPEPVTNCELLKMGKRIKEVPVYMHERDGGVSSINSWKNVYFMINIFLSIFSVGLRRIK